jgi:ribosomal protein L7/L12
MAWIKVLRELTGLGLVEAQALVDLGRQRPVVLDAVTKTEAADAVERLESVGATAVSVPV